MTTMAERLAALKDEYEDLLEAHNSLVDEHEDLVEAHNSVVESMQKAIDHLVERVFRMERFALSQGEVLTMLTDQRIADRTETHDELEPDVVSQNVELTDTPPT